MTSNLLDLIRAGRERRLTSSAHIIWQREDESDAAVEARIEAMRRSGAIGLHQEVITVRWRRDSDR